MGVGQTPQRTFQVCIGRAGQIFAARWSSSPKGAGDSVMGAEVTSPFEGTHSSRGTSVACRAPTVSPLQGQLLWHVLIPSAGPGPELGTHLGLC